MLYHAGTNGADQSGEYMDAIANGGEAGASTVSSVYGSMGVQEIPAEL